MLNYENDVLKTRMRWMMADLRDACAGYLDAIRAIGSFDPDAEELEEQIDIGYLFGGRVRRR